MESAHPSPQSLPVNREGERLPRALQALVCTRYLALDRGRLFYSCRPAAIRCVNVRLQAQAAAHAAQGASGSYGGGPHSLDRTPASSAAAAAAAAFSGAENGLAAGFSRPGSLPSHVGIAATGLSGLPGGGTDASVDEALIVVGDGGGGEGTTGRASDGPVPPVRHLLCEGKTLLFALRDRLYAYSRRSGTVTATFRHFEAAQPQSKRPTAAEDAEGDHDGEPLGNGSVSLRTAQSGQRTAAAGEVPHICGVSSAGDAVLVQYPRVVYVMDRLSLERTPLRVLQVVHLPCETLAVADFGPHLLALAHPSVGSRDGLGEPRTRQSLYVMEQSCSLAAAKMPAKMPAASAVVRQVLRLPPRAGPAVTLAPAFALQSDESEGYNTFTNTHIFIATASTLLVVRAARPSEQVALLAKQGHFATAQHLVQQRHKQPKVLVEVSNAYACQLWHHVRDRAAVYSLNFLSDADVSPWVRTCNSDVGPH